MRASLPALLVTIAALVAGCGGEDVRVEEVPGSPPPLALPASEAGDAGSVTADQDDADASTDDDDDPDATVTDDAPTDTGGVTVPPADTGGSAPAATPTATPAPQDPAATGGAEADAGSDAFCADNPGAC